MLTLSNSVNVFMPAWSISVFTAYRSSLPSRQSLCARPMSHLSPAFPEGLGIGRNLRGASYGGYIWELAWGLHSSYFFLQWRLEAKVLAIQIPTGAGSKERIQH